MRFNLELNGEVLDVAVENLVHSCIDVFVAESLVPEGLAHNLLVRLAIVAMLQRSGSADRVLEGASHGPSSGTVRPHQRAIDIEQGNLHSPWAGSGAESWRVSSRPPSTAAAPRP